MTELETTVRKLFFKVLVDGEGSIKSIEAANTVALQVKIPVIDVLDIMQRVWFKQLPRELV